MKINSIIANHCIGFGAKILNEQNEDSVRQLRAKFDDLKQNGIPVGDCFYTIPEDKNVNLTTNDKKYKAGMSCWGDNLVISEKMPDGDMKKAVIAPDGDVLFCDSLDNNEIEYVEENSDKVNYVNDFLNKILSKFIE